MHNDQLVYKVVIWEFLEISLLKEKVAFRCGALINVGCLRIWRNLFGLYIFDDMLQLNHSSSVTETCLARAENLLLDLVLVFWKYGWIYFIIWIAYLPKNSCQMSDFPNKNENWYFKMKLMCSCYTVWLHNINFKNLNDFIFQGGTFLESHIRDLPQFWPPLFMHSEISLTLPFVISVIFIHKKRYLYTWIVSHILHG